MQQCQMLERNTRCKKNNCDGHKLKKDSSAKRIHQLRHPEQHFWRSTIELLVSVDTVTSYSESDGKAFYPFLITPNNRSPRTGFSSLKH